MDFDTDIAKSLVAGWKRPYPCLGFGTEIGLPVTLTNRLPAANAEAAAFDGRSYVAGAGTSDADAWGRSAWDDVKSTRNRCSRSR